MNNSAIARHFQRMRRAASRLDVTLQPLTANSRDELEQAFATITRERVDALFVYLDLFPHRTEIAEFARTHQLPTMTNAKGIVRDGCLMSYGRSMPDDFRRAAACVDKILRWAKPADLPVSRPTQFDLAINLKTTKALGLTIRPEVLFQSDKVIW